MIERATSSRKRHRRVVKELFMQLRYNYIFPGIACERPLSDGCNEARQHHAGFKRWLPPRDDLASKPFRINHQPCIGQQLLDTFIRTGVTHVTTLHALVYYFGRICHGPGSLKASSTLFATHRSSPLYYQPLRPVS
jgi:hypothetical protein